MTPDQEAKLTKFATLMEKDPSVQAMYSAGFGSLMDFADAVTALPKDSPLRARIKKQNEVYLKLLML